MKKNLAKIPNYFLSVYKDYPWEIQQKMQNLFLLSVGAKSIFFIMLIRAIWWKGDPIEAITVGYCIGVLFLTLLLIRLKKPVSAGTTSICAIFYPFGNYMIRDLLSLEFKQISRINDTAVVILFGIILTTTFVIRRRQYLFLLALSYFVLISHYLALEFHFYGGMFKEETFKSFLETWAIVSISLFVGFTTLSLTTHKRGSIFNNIIFYKMGDKGPEVAYSEHSLGCHEECSSAAYFYTIIGQGAQYATGLFGPIPFGACSDKKVALIYATRIRDSELKDARLQHLNYFLIGLITTPDKATIVSRDSLEKRLGILTREISDLKGLTADNYKLLVEKIHSI